MKTFFKSIFKFLQSIFLQLILAIVAIETYDATYRLGSMFNSEVGTYEKKVVEDYEQTSQTIGTSIAMDSGYDGGAIAMGIICSVCIVMIVWLEINKKSKE